MGVYISGRGLVSALGSGVDEAWARALRGDTGITRDYKISETNRNILFAPIVGFPEEDRFYMVVRQALIECIESAGLSEDELANTGLIFACGTPEGEAVFSEYEFINSRNRSKPSSVYRTMNSYISAKLSKEFGIKATVVTASAACTGSALAIHLANSLIRSGALERCFCGGGEVIGRFAHLGFEGMRVVLAKRTGMGAMTMQPFGKNRSGIVLGEAAGFILLEDGEVMDQAYRKTMAKLDHSVYINCPEAKYGDISAEDWKKLLLAQKESKDKVGYLVAHGTSTQVGDHSEGHAINSTLQNVLVSSYKYYFGHTLSASTIVDVIMMTKCFECDVLLGVGLNYKQDIFSEGVRLLQDNVESRTKVAVKLSAGFGGGFGSLSLINPNY